MVLEPGQERSEDEIQRHCGERFAKWQLPDEILFVDEIPMTGTGKIDKKAIRSGLERDGYQLPDLRG